MKVTVFGIGYVGLVQAAVLAEAGHQVCCVDVNPKRVADLQAGIIPIYEPGLSALVQQGVAQGLLQFTTDGAAGVAFGELQFIAVGTPPDEDGSADLKYVLAVASTIATHMTSPKVVINKSTVPVGTGDKVKAVLTTTLKTRQQDLQFAVVSNPEFLKEGAAVADCQRPDRIILGTDNPWAEKLLRELYMPFNRNHDKIIVMDIRSAELTKYAANCMLATKISFMNEMSNLAELLGADIEQVRHGIGSDPRIGYHFIYPGCGYGGSCFPKDVQALIKTAEQTGYNTQLLKSVEAVNNQQKHKLFGFLQQHFAGDLQGKTIAIWGLSFKPNTDDMREASSRVLMESLWQAGATVQAFDPEAMEETQRIYGSRADLKLVGTKEAALQNADVLVICTEWKSFRSPDFSVLKQQLKQPVIVDGRNLFEPSRLRELGFTYYAIGRGDSVKQF
ncbi:UDP-glucose/GDP-mannose dehydrogenase family protein [Rheinheimera riviphila]|uniref:UDP-glucose 6-dehydrogenase n=1 Tax=Rheinheimera riviphila TaxID=1834037 RepID=A0A437R3G4_9GAMM|nr:UDP-glucose/GDP-mannose dehydrogenase family protein [Rheinheimera riviphila]RVU41301.1 UDP-glucose/GDP-mannose dehydrogenase family protein [Rheinheimera riviphila]